MIKLLIILIVLQACKSVPQPIRYYWERSSKDISERTKNTSIKDNRFV